MGQIDFHHVALTCRNITDTERFYTKHFGFQRARVIPFGETEIIFLRLGNSYLELFQANEESPVASATADGAPSPDGAPSGDGVHYPGVRHMGFKVEDVDAKLDEMGDEAVVTFGPFDFDDFVPGWRTVWLSDPDGNIVEVSHGYKDQDNPPPLE